MSDDAKGVQWNTGVDRHRGVATLGVNLEGMQYDGWPIARLIERELRHPLFPSIAESSPELAAAELWFSRDAWQKAARPPIVEQWIGGIAPVRVDALTPEQWRATLVEAYACLDESRGHRGRARQDVTLIKKGKTSKEVSPHLQVKQVLSAPVNAGEQKIRSEMERARDILRPVREWAIQAARD